jgi:hypothetical protein
MNRALLPILYILVASSIITAFFCAHPIYRRHLNLTSAQPKKKSTVVLAIILQIKRESKGHKKYAILATEAKKKGVLAMYSSTRPIYKKTRKNKIDGS